VIRNNDSEAILPLAAQTEYVHGIVNKGVSGGASFKERISMNRSPRVVILRSNPVAPDPRVEKTARSLQAAGYKVQVVAWDRSCREGQTLSTDLDIHRIPQRGDYGRGIFNAFSFLMWSQKLLRWLFRNRKSYDIIHACDFDTVVPAFLVTVLLRKKLVYDIFDFIADASRNMPKPILVLVRNLDLWLISHADLVVLADDSRRAQIHGSKPRRLTVTYNSPEASLPFTPQAPLTPAFNIGFVGTLMLDRGLSEMIQAISGDSRFHLHLAGFGGDEMAIRGMCKELPNVTFHGKVTYTHALEIYSGCQLMFAIYDPRNPNQRFSSPNKAFESLMLGLPVVVAKDSGIDELVRRHNMGYVVPYQDDTALKNTLEAALSESSKEREERSRQLKHLFNTEFAWERQGARLVGEYENMIKES